MQQSHRAWNTIAYSYLRRQNVTSFIEPDMWPPSSPDLNPVNYTIWVVLHFLLYAVYICQKSLNFTYALKCYKQNCSWLHFTWTTLYITCVHMIHTVIEGGSVIGKQTGGHFNFAGAVLVLRLFWQKVIWLVTVIRISVLCSLQCFYAVGWVHEQLLAHTELPFH